MLADVSERKDETKKTKKNFSVDAKDDDEFMAKSHSFSNRNQAINILDVRVENVGYYMPMQEGKMNIRNVVHSQLNFISTSFK